VFSHSNRYYALRRPELLEQLSAQVLATHDTVTDALAGAWAGAERGYNIRVFADRSTPEARRLFDHITGPKLSSASAVLSAFSEPIRVRLGDNRLPADARPVLTYRRRNAR
jgi:hypothetical protein